MDGLRRRSHVDHLDPTISDVHNQAGRRPSAGVAVQEGKKLKVANNKGLTGASALTARQSLLPCALVTILFWLWGFAYGLLDTLNAKFQTDLNVTAARAGGLQAAYFGAYFIGPLTWGGFIVRKFGYRWTFITGLIIYGIGALMFWPSAKFESFGGFCASLFIVGGGLSTLEVSADPYLAVCGPPRLSEFRLETAQGFQAIGSVIAPIVASHAFFNVDATDPHSLENVQWTYLAIAAFVFLLAVVFFFAPIPEVTDADMELQAEQSAGLTGYEEGKSIWTNTKLMLAVMAQFCYVGAQVAVASQFISYAQHVAHLSAANASNRYAVGQGVFAIGRFASAGILLYVKPRYVLFVSSTAIIVFIVLAMAIKGEAGLAMLTVVLFFESNQFPLILTIGIKGLGRHTKLGSSFIIAAISGGAFFPAMCGLAADKYGWNVAMFVPLIGFILSWFFALYVNTVSAKELDGARESKIGYKDESGAVIGDIKNDINPLGSDRKGSVTYVEMGPTSSSKAAQQSQREL